MNADAVKLILREVPAQDVAVAASEQRAIADVYTCVVKDQFMPEIVLGHGLVVVAYGSEVSIERIKKLLIEAGRPSL